jgi:hypothetical protein
MSHLISPTVIDGDLYCHPCSSGFTTHGVETFDHSSGANGAIITTPCGPWQLAEVLSGFGMAGEISFGVICSSTVTITLTPSGGTSGTSQYEVYVKGVFISDNSGQIGISQIVSEVIEIVDSPCGNVITVVIVQGLSDGIITLAVAGTS